MAFGWDDLILLGSTLFGADQAGKAADAQKRGGQNALAEQQRQFNAALAMLEPQRGVGYGALSDIANLYGYAVPEYTPLNALTGGGGVNLGKHASTGAAVPGANAFTSPISVNGRRGSSSILGQPTNPLSSHNRAFGGTIDPVTGTVDLQNIRNPKKEDKREAAATAYLRGETDKLGGKKMRRIRSTINAMMDQGYEYNPNAVAEAAAAPPTAGVTGPGSMDRFFASPDYEFRRNEGTRNIEQGAAARGGALSGNALRAVSEYNSNLASGEFGNYMNRLFNIAGMGQTATGQAVNAGQSYANNAGNIMQGIGDSRASGIMGTGNTLLNGLGNWMNYRALNRYSADPMSGLEPVNIWQRRI